MPPSYAPLPGSRYVPEDAQRELDDAFDSDDEGQDSSEFTPLTRPPPPRSDSHYHPPLDGDFPEVLPTPQTAPGGYDFERDYDCPPPGSPPSPSSRALPNDFGNSNGYVPTSPVRPPQPRQSFWRRAAGALLPQHYVRVPTEAPSSRIIGGGTDNDGVFANVAAKPSRGIEITDANGDVHIVPEEVQKETPPSYAEAQADAAPSYWETTVHAPAGTLDPNSYMIVDDLPSGPVFTFIMTAFVSYFFQFAGFVLTYLLHTTHAAKYGSRAGLGMTLIQFGLLQYGNGGRTGMGDSDISLEEEIARWNSTRMAAMNGSSMGMGNYSGLNYNATDPNAVMDDMELQFAVTTRDWVSLILMTLGWFLLLSSCVGFYRVKRWESSIRAASLPSEPITPEQRARDEQVRRNIEMAFGFSTEPHDEPERPSRRQADDDDDSEPRGNMTEAELRLTRTLQAAGLL
ncbi:hypothetical protein C8Q80DRAFT_1162047 [Daedaleopsis nitida]|nr:hypothetical protein C8Q80DRAFT_1162047 [Daedaleopsis nitida]